MMYCDLRSYRITDNDYGLGGGRGRDNVSVPRKSTMRSGTDFNSI